MPTVMPTGASEPTVAVTAVTVTDESLVVELTDGRTMSAPIGWYPRLAHAATRERNDHRIIGNGTGIHWPDLDEDISVASVIVGRPSMESAASLKRWLASRAR